MYVDFIKRVIDVTLALIALPFWLTLLAVVGPIVYFEDKGSVFYNAPRLGRNGEIYKMFKFRSMKMNSPDLRNSDGSTFNSEDDPRLTRVGRFLRNTSLDETPQILNILRGDMSIIGPRPDLPEQYELYEGNEARKLSVRPGITGYNQAYFRNAVPWKERIQNDLFYIDHVSFWLDAKIFIKTIVSVWKRRDVYVIEPNNYIVPHTNKDFNS